ncbi:hypothetical protein EB796_020421 [Bugula neritina]|uniref:5'-nucleotidase n=1 Tax=Bugula neritina TaxID=10212 RepID=A0A7J7J5W0_BUGNE|nr:hypothetical protein EB796_020421 [Bugula neritina]
MISMKLRITILLTVASAFASEYKLTLLHTNDIHSRIDEAHKYGGVCSSSHSAAGDCVGGAARLATKIKEINSTSDNLLLLDGGDQFQGTFWFFVYRGMAAALVMKELGYDAMAIGNHEFDLGLEALQQFIHNVSDSFDVLSANIDNTDEPGLVGYKPFVIRGSWWAENRNHWLHYSRHPRSNRSW